MTASTPAPLERSYRKAWVLAGLTVVAYMAAANREQPLVWALAALFLAALVLGFFWPRWLVRRLVVVRAGPARAVEGEAITLRVSLHNGGWWPRYMIEVTDTLPFVGAAAGRGGCAPVLVGQVAVVPGGGQRGFAIPVVCEKRGRYRLGPVGLATSFPLGLVEARGRGQGGLQELVVYPEVFPIASLPLAGTPYLMHRGSLLLPDGSGQAEFRNLREYRPGDNPRHVHWPSSSRLNTLVVKEFEPLAGAALGLVLDLEATAHVGLGKRHTLEYMIKIAASMAAHACARGMPVRLLGQGASPLDIPPASGDLHYRQLLDALAVVEADGAVSYARVLGLALPACQPGENIVAFLAGPATGMAAAIGELAMLRARGAHLLIIVFDRDSFATPGLPPREIPAALLELGARVIPVRCDDDLVQCFNG